VWGKKLGAQIGAVVPMSSLVMLVSRFVVFVTPTAGVAKKQGHGKNPSEQRPFPLSAPTLQAYSHGGSFIMLFCWGKKNVDRARAGGRPKKKKKKGVMGTASRRPTV